MLWTPAGEQNGKCYWNNLLFTASHCRQHGSFSWVINFQSIFHSARICRILLNNSVEKILWSLKQKIKLQSRIKSGSNGPKHKVSNRQKIIRCLINKGTHQKKNCGKFHTKVTGSLIDKLLNFCFHTNSQMQSKVKMF